MSRYPRGTMAGMPRRPHPALSAITRTGTNAARLRAELVAAEREHNDAILAAVALANPEVPSQPLLSVRQIALAAGTTRAPIYKRIQRAKQGGSYGTRPHEHDEAVA